MTDIGWSEEEELDQQINEAEKLVRTLRYKKISAEREAARKCYWCGCTDDENEFKNGYGSLLDFRLEVCVGEEGYSNIVRYMCDPCAAKVIPKLIEIGFSQHHHGSTCMMEDDKCIGAKEYGSCPTPEDPWEIKVWPV